jgi:glycosyltransferase involved in cell wall biosynthesis
MMVELLPRRPKLMLAMVGDTEDAPQREALHRECERLGLGGHVLWTGWLPADVAWRWVRAARVALSPIPRGELLDVSSPTKLPEYMALGVPVVCNDNPDQAAVVAQSGAGRCVTYTAQNFALAVEELLDLPDADRAAMVQRGQRWVAQHRDYAVLGRQLAARYGELLAPQLNLDRRVT